MTFLCVCVCIVLCNVYWCELMLDSKRNWMRNFLEEINNKVKLNNWIEYKPKKRQKKNKKTQAHWR